MVIIIVIIIIKAKAKLSSRLISFNDINDIGKDMNLIKSST